MKNKKILKIGFIIALIIWLIILVKQQINLEQHKEELEVLSTKVDIAKEKLEKNKQELSNQQEKTKSLEYIEELAREKLGMYLQNERVYVDSNM